MIRSVNYNQTEIIANILTLFCPHGIDLDPTYSVGGFYKNGRVNEPLLKFDIIPKADDVVCADACNLPLKDKSIRSIIFDPPFVVGGKSKKNVSIIGNRYGEYRKILDLYSMYKACIHEFYRILIPKGILIFKCQDTVVDHKQYLTHNYIVNCAEIVGFCVQDLFILLAKNRLIDPRWKNQQHARKYHSYFLVFKKH